MARYHLQVDVFTPSGRVTDSWALNIAKANRGSLVDYILEKAGVCIGRITCIIKSNHAIIPSLLDAINHLDANDILVLQPEPKFKNGNEFYLLKITFISDRHIGLTIKSEAK